MIRSRGHCNTMGTASTMGLLAEALGTTLPGTAGTAGPGQPSARGRRTRPGGWSSRWSREDRRPSTVLTAGSFRNAIVALAAIGGSTNAVVHLLAIAGRLGVDAHRSTTSTASAPTSRCSSTCSRPAGILMEDFHRAGGLQAVLREVADLLDPDAPHRHRQAAGRLPRRGADLGPRGHPGRATSRCSRRRASRCCAATSPPAAPSSSPPPHRRTCSRTAGAPSSSTASRTSTPASTIRTWTWTRTRCWSCAAAAPGATPGCRRWRTCRCRPSSSSRACATWCGSATAG